MHWSDLGAPGAWAVAALLLGIAELVVPGVFLIFLGAAAAVTGAIAYALPDMPMVAQLVAFAVWSVVAVLIGRRWYSDYPVATTDPLLNDRAARMIGDIVIVEEPLVGGRGRVRVGDGGWPARGDDAATGERLRVVAVDNGVLLVERPAIDRGRDRQGSEA